MRSGRGLWCRGNFATSSFGLRVPTQQGREFSPIAQATELPRGGDSLSRTAKFVAEGVFCNPAPRRSLRRGCETTTFLLLAESNSWKENVRSPPSLCYTPQLFVCCGLKGTSPPVCSRQVFGELWPASFQK